MEVTTPVRMPIGASKGILKTGMWVRTNGSGRVPLLGDGRAEVVEGYIGEFFEELDGHPFYKGFCLWQNSIRGTKGHISPETRGFEYSWAVFWHCPGWIEILEEKHIPLLSNIKEDE